MGGGPMGSRLRSMTRSGSILVLAWVGARLGLRPNEDERAALRDSRAVGASERGGGGQAGQPDPRGLVRGEAADRRRRAGERGRHRHLHRQGRQGGRSGLPAQRFGGKGDDAATGIAVDDDGSIVLAGTFQGEAAFGEQRFEGRRPPRGPARRVRRPAGPRGQGRLGQTDRRRQPADPGQRRRRPRSQHRGRRDRAPPPSPRKTASWLLAGQSVTLDVLSPKGDPIPQRGSQLMARSFPVGCAHSPCQQGGVLVPGCGPDDCIAWICAVGSLSVARFAWDSICVGEVSSVCQRRCDCGKICVQGRPVLSRCLRLHGQRLQRGIPTAEKRTGTASASERPSPGVHLTCP